MNNGLHQLDYIRGRVVSEQVFFRAQEWSLQDNEWPLALTLMRAVNDGENTPWRLGVKLLNPC
ncbi:hypothetical protein DSLASN_04290 [Desulfoluna limicola]|uniref:Uncharacterized protein n=1 Tax=Desulfoluna limicola TaxID=2810562 RepID=A0ABN6EWS0_9BACT|nr:hypothetical protein DSLASN_04290 [Desulfoluna limicola]